MYTRIAGLSNSFGYRIAFSHAGGLGGNGIPTSGWFQRTGAAFYNDAVSTTIVQASTSYSYPATGVTQVTDSGGRVWRFAGTANGITAIRRPGATSDTTGIAYSSGSSVSSVTNEGVTTSYSRSVSGTTATMTVTNALSQVSTVVSDLTIGRPTSITDPLSHTTSFTYDTSGRPKRTTAHEGNYVELTYDTRGNVTQTEAVPKGGTGARIVTSASYDSTCANPVTCNRPNSVTDARGNVTDYTYDSTHGGVLTATGPAVNGVRPQTRYSYTLTNGEYRLTGISACQTTGSCAGTADEAKSTLAYDSNGNVTSTSSGDGAGALAATGAMTYDALGNLLTVDGPLSGTADTSHFRYNAARQVIGTVSPDPDGGGSLKPRAVRSTYTNGLLTKVETGNVNSQSDADWAAFSPAQAAETDYDANARPVKQRLVAGGTNYALTQTGHDALGRPECTAQRMNPAIFSTITTGACSLGTQGSGSTDFGPDRIVKTIYDPAGRVTQVKSAYGVSGEEANEVTTTYTANGLVETLTDAESNKTTYVYDGHDRLSITQFPVATKGAGASSTSDYKQTTYESVAGGTRTSGLVAAFRNRAGETTAFGYDALGRLVSKDRPGSELDVAYAYDLLGRMTGASQTGHSLGFTWDSLGRLMSQSGPHGTLLFNYDAAGRRNRFEWSDGFYLNYSYLVTGEMTAVAEDPYTGSATISLFGYDDLGRRTSLSGGDGGVAGYSYDAVSRPSQLTLNLIGTTYDQTLGFGYNPAGQIASTTRSNDLFAWTGHGSGTTNSTADGLNRLVNHGGTSLSYDARGNLTSDGSTTFAYDSENKLVSASGAKNATLAYDPLGRLYQVTAGAATTRFEYDGDEIVAEYDGSGARLRRYVSGPGADEPLAWYEGSWTLGRRWLHADERGSIAAVTDVYGATIAVNRYDEYGKPQGNPAGRFGYTGQAWLPELGLYYYKARFYNPALVRFMQTDPIGYAGGINPYAYAGNDPVNSSDPSGLCRDENGDFYEPQTGTRLCDQKPSPSGVAGGGNGGSGNGGGSGGGKLVGGPLNGSTSCPNCIGASDSRVGASIRRWGGYYDQGTWVSVGGSSSIGSFVGANFYLASGPQGGTTLVPSLPLPWDPHLDSAAYAPTPGEIAAIRSTYGIVRDQINTGYYSNRKVFMKPYDNTGPLAFLPPPRGAYYEATVFFGGNMGRGSARIVVDTGNLGSFFYTPNHYRWFMVFVVGH